MKFVFALIALFAVSALAQPYAVTSVYSDNACQNIVGQYITSPDVVSSNRGRSVDLNLEISPNI
jgi:hypothetical protein